MQNVSWLKMLAIVAIGLMLMALGSYINGWMALPTAMHLYQIGLARMLFGDVIAACGILAFMLGVVASLQKMLD